MPPRDPTPPPPPLKTLACPECGLRSTELSYCPQHGVALVDAATVPERVAPAAEPLRCPRCHKTWGPLERFCPDDGAPLAPASAPSAASPAAAPAIAGGGRCPKCGRSYAAPDLFCHDDGARLEPV